MVTVWDLYEHLHVQGSTGERILAIRHDVDITNVAGNEMFFRAERAADARSTFYFRLSTAAAHRSLIARLLAEGHEVGYHFEEGATLAKRWHAREGRDIVARQAEVTELFIANCERFRREFNPGLASVASHGDWLNRRLGFINNELLDPETLAAAGVRFEAYDEVLMDGAEVYVSDVATGWGGWARGVTLGDAIAAGMSPIYLLAHERRWHTSARANLREDAIRLWETVRYGVATRLDRVRGARSGSSGHDALP
jgi:hypothetical protein